MFLRMTDPNHNPYRTTKRLKSGSLSFSFTHDGTKAGQVVKDISLHGKRDRTNVPFSREFIKDSSDNC